MQTGSMWQSSQQVLQAYRCRPAETLQGWQALPPQQALQTPAATNAAAIST